MLDWIFEGIVNWISSIVSQMMDAVSGLFLQALGTDMTAMEEYFPFVSKAFTVMQYTAWAVLFLITVWQLFRVFGGPITEAENPWTLLARSSIFALLIGYAKPIFMITLDIARAPYTALMELSMTAEDFTFAGVEEALSNGLTTIVAVVSVVGLLLLVILEISLGWNYFKLLLETVERYIVVGVLCYTSPLAFSMGASKTTAPVFKSWCRMVGSQLLLLVMNVWFLRGFNSSVGQYMGNGGALSTGQGSIFLWLFCALAFLKTAQKFDSYLAAMGLNVAQTGSSMGMELLMAARVISGVGGSARSAGSVFKGGGSAVTGTGAAASGFAVGFASKFKGNSYVRDAVMDGGVRMGAGGSVGFVGRAFGGMAAPPMEEAAPQTEMNPELEEMELEEMHDAIDAEGSPPQTETEMAEPDENSADLNSDANAEGVSPQTEPEEPKKTRGRKKTEKKYLSLTQKHILMVRMSATASRIHLSPAKGRLLPNPNRWCPLMNVRL